jgi:ubiquinone/menaquinone biosynthesis C-methylase UbiE
LGFGTGAFLAEMAQTGRPVVGLDASQPMLRIAARRLATQGLSAPCVQGVGQKLPFSDNAFIAVISTFPAAYILAPETLSECRRVLCPQGRLVIVGLWVTPVNRLLRSFLPFFFGAPSPALTMSIRKTLGDANFSEIRCENRNAGWVSVGVIIASRSAS